MEGFEGGNTFARADNWTDVIPKGDSPIQYLEIGVHSGVNLVFIEKLYAKHPDSRMYAIDPWEDYSEYKEYKGEQDKTYNVYCRHIKKFGIEDKVNTLRGYSHAIVPTLKDNFFDIIYIDGNHNPEYVLEDGVVAFRKLKINGYLIFDDYGFDGPTGTKLGIDAFISAYARRIRVLCIKWTYGLGQVFIQKLS